MTVVLILFCVIVLPIWLALHYLTRWRTARAFSNEDQKLLEDLWRSANTIERRITTIETILDVEPNVRSRHHV